MDKLKKIQEIRAKLVAGQPSVGGWIQIPHPCIAEIMGALGFDWVCIDSEHGAIERDNLNNLIRSIELGGSLPLVRLGEVSEFACKTALDAGASGLIMPNIKSKEQLELAMSWCAWPPKGRRGVGYSRSNLFGVNFEKYKDEAQSPFIVAMIETIDAVDELQSILNTAGLDAIFIGPYDLSASMGLTGKFDHPDFLAKLEQIVNAAKSQKVPSGLHVISPEPDNVVKAVGQGHTFIAYSTDAFALSKALEFSLKP